MGYFFGVSRHRIDTNQYFLHISWLKLLVPVINELSCMKIGLTWPGTTRRVRSILQQPKTQQNHNYCASIENQLQMHCYFLHILIYEALLRSRLEINCETCGLI